MMSELMNSPTLRSHLPIIDANMEEALGKNKKSVRFHLPNEKREKKRSPREASLGLHFSSSRLKNLLKNGNYAHQIEKDATVYLTTVIDYICIEVMESSVSYCTLHQKNRVDVSCVMHGIYDDILLRALLFESAYAIYKERITKSKSSKANKDDEIIDIDIPLDIIEPIGCNKTVGELADEDTASQTVFHPNEQQEVHSLDEEKVSPDDDIADRFGRSVYLCFRDTTSSYSISKKALYVVCHVMYHLFLSIAEKVSQLANNNHPSIFSVQLIETVITTMFPGELAEIAIDNAENSLHLFSKYK